jgi:tetratricopeptide (TPR) repeat protein
MATLDADLDSRLAQVETALAERDSTRAFALLEPLRAHLDTLPRLAAVWLTLLRIAPSRQGLAADVARIIQGFPRDQALRLSGCDALIRAAELPGPDAPAIAGGPAEQAVALASESVAQLSAAERADPKVGGYWHMNLANALRLAHRHDEASPAYEAALALDPDNGDWWFNHGLLFKAQGDFERGLATAQRACELLGEPRGALWNVALCATALGRGEIAAAAMRKLGFPARVEANGMPSVDDLPPLQVRVATIGAGIGFAGADLDRGVAFELVWVSPVSPVHGVVQTPTFREASVDYGDVVLWDGTPLGMTQHEGRSVPRFPLLARLHAGDERRLRFLALERHAGATQALGDELPAAARMFVQRARLESLCARCASGEHTREHVHLAQPQRLVYGKLIVPVELDLAEFRSTLEAALARQPAVQLVMPALLEALGETKAAGKAHQMWSGLERAAARNDAVALPRA